MGWPNRDPEVLDVAREEGGDGMLLVMEGTVTPVDREASPYLYLPFSVPAGTERITVRYTYGEGNVLDIGLVDPGRGDARICPRGRSSQVPGR